MYSIRSLISLARRFNYEIEALVFIRVNMDRYIYMLNTRSPPNQFLDSWLAYYLLPYTTSLHWYYKDSHHQSHETGRHIQLVCLQSHGSGYHPYIHHYYTDHQVLLLGGLHDLSEILRLNILS